eukprot:scaffold32503_cov20-Tisochrysis_lutea.AAC.1
MASVIHVHLSSSKGFAVFISRHGSSRDKADAKPGKAAKNRQYRRKLEQDTKNEENAVQSVRASQ